MASKVDLYDKLTSKIVEDLQNGLITWEKPWFVCKAVNATTGKPYRGINQLNLATVSAELNLDSADMRFLTFNQAKHFFQVAITLVCLTVINSRH